ncbi:MAG: tetraacyldisaccharide 4'-kinase [Acidobacteriia bacterium]|nr:tetraacyldisaccharide 4'-kinase [Terriglobia bacterium]
MSTAIAAGILKRTINATRFIYFLYQVLQIALSPALVLYLLYRGLRDPRYFNRLDERFGFLPPSFKPTGPGSIWFHAVSVGEVLSAIELIQRVRRVQPHAEIFVSVSTLAGREVADRHLAGLANGVFYAPLDYRSIIRRILRRLRPAVVVVLETEIWPNLYRESKRAGAGLLVANGRISDRALPRYQRWSWFFRHVLRWPDAILVQSQQDRERYLIAGAPEDRVRVAGNLKYDFTPPAVGIVPDLAGDPIWIAASTTAPVEAADPDEDDVVIEAFKRISVRYPLLLLVLAPRRPERFPVVAAKLEQAGVPYSIRSQSGFSNLTPGVLLLDSIGELAGLFERATVVFMGGTLPRRGGHNILEPAYFGKPVIVGPHMENFAAIIEEFSAADAVVKIDAPGALAGAVEALLDNPAHAAEIGTRARTLAMAKRGTADHIVQQLLRAADESVPDPPHTLEARLTRGPLAAIWNAGHAVNIYRTRPKKLEIPVISVGALTMGGAGKSPLVAHLAQRLAEAGRNPAILTRGYGRKSRLDVIVPRGGSAPVVQTGDEAQTYVRQAAAHVGIGGDRYEIGRRMERELNPDVFLLDDGFQHFRLRRDQDIVLIDALDPLGGGVFPLGRLREPFKALARASIIIISRAENQHVGIERLIRRYNPWAPIFRARIVARVEGDELASPVGAFCGLGQPRTFWRTLETLGVKAAPRLVFRDHHRYTAGDLEEIGRQAAHAGAQALLTTEKDFMNLPTGVALPLKIYCLRIGIEIENEAELLRHLLVNLA